MRARLQNVIRPHPGLIVVLVLYVIVAVLYGALIPIFESPDANGHYAYIHELTEGRGFPIHDTPSGERVTGYVAGHAPLYYMLSAAAAFWVPDDVDFDDWAWFNPFHAMGNANAPANKNRLVHTGAEAFPWRGTPLTVHIARLVSTGFGVLGVIATYGIMLELFPERRWLALGAAALTAFNPMYIFTTARVSNDAAAAGFGPLTVWCAVRLTVRGFSRRGLVLAGAVYGLAALSKLSCIALGPAVALALLLDVLRVGHYKVGHLFRRDQLLRLLVNAIILFGTTILIAGWWYVRNLILYGELMGVDAWISRTATVWPEPIGFFEVVPFLKDMQISYWAMFGWFNIAGARWMYQIWWVLVGLAGVGLVFALADQWSPRRFPRPAQMGLVIVSLAFLLILGSVWRFIMIVPGAQGRYLMPVAAAISVFLVLGLDRFILNQFTPGLAVLLGVGNLVIALVCLFAFILPAYATPDVVEESELPEDMMRFDMTFQDTPIQLLGGIVESDEAHPGEVVVVSLYWRALEPVDEDPFLFAQILGKGGEPIAGVDCYPGGGNFPATLWQPGVIYRDRYRLSIAADAEAPAIVALHAGLRWRGGTRLVGLFPSGEPVPEPVLFDLAALRPVETPPTDVTYSVDARLGDAITLVGYDLSVDEVQPGESLTVTLVWRAGAVPAGDYTAFVHLIDEDGNLVAQDDHPPLMGEYRTSFWARGDVIRDTYNLTLDASQPSCVCALLVGLYDPEARVRVPAYDGLGERFEDDAVVAGRVTVK
ncbi:MAG: glycosyltransferase family 39 protein [Anaerolineae bacterium]|nr:glycosyltransferase family 39 protein [Anaerolineae bacterium]